MATGQLRGEVFIAEVCLRYGWTYDEYWNQPEHFIATIQGKMEADEKRRKIEENAAKNKQATKR